MAQTFHCPACGAALEYEESGATTVRCPYCNSTVVVPESVRSRREEPSKPMVIHTALPTYTTIETPSTGQVGGFLGAMSCMTIVLPLIIIVAVFGVVGYVLYNAFSDTGLLSGFPGSDSSSGANEPGLSRPTTTPRPDDTAVPTPTPGFAEVVLAFGDEGIGPGLFEDARAIAVDGEGHIYVGDYTGGRIQVFDADGKFMTQWMVDSEKPLRGLAADRQGTVYVVQGGEIYIHEGKSGALLGQVAYGPGWGFDNLVVTADGGLVAAWYKNRDDIVRFDNSGNVTLTIEAAISGQTGDSELNHIVAVDGLGNIYALGSFNDAVFKFSPDGRFLNMFGGDGNAPGQFRAPQAIAVDGQGRVYVSDIKGIQVFDADGRYLEVIELRSVSGMVFTDQNELLVVARTQVMKLVLTGE